MVFRRGPDVWTTHWWSRRRVGALLLGALTVCLALFAGPDDSMFDTSLGSSSVPLDIFGEELAPPPPPPACTPPPLTIAELQTLPKLDMPALKKLCAAHDLKQSGVKAQLIARLKGESEPEHQPRPRGPKRKAAETSGEGEGDDATELLYGTELLQAIANGTAEPNANPSMMLCGPDAIGQARDLLLLSNEAAVAKLEAAMIKDPKKDFAWLIETGLKEYLVPPQEEGGASADGGGAPGFECVDSPLVQRLLAKAKAKEGDEIEPQSMDYGQCPLGPEEIAKLMEGAGIGIVICDSVVGRHYAQAGVMAWCEENSCMWLYHQMEALNMIIRCARKHASKCPAHCACAAWNGTEGSDCLNYDIGYGPLHKLMLLGLANSRMPVVVLKPLAESTNKFVRDELAPYATFCLDLLRYRLGDVGLPAKAVALVYTIHMKFARGSMHQRRLDWLERTVTQEADALAALAGAYGFEVVDLDALKASLHSHMRCSMLDDPVGCLKPEWLPETHGSELAQDAQEALKLSKAARSKLAQAYGEGARGQLRRLVEACEATGREVPPAMRAMLEAKAQAQRRGKQIRGKQQMNKLVPAAGGSGVMVKKASTMGRQGGAAPRGDLVNRKHQAIPCPECKQLRGFWAQDKPRGKRYWYRCVACSHEWKQEAPPQITVAELAECKNLQPVQ